jgi:hypothetical protein
VEVRETVPVKKHHPHHPFTFSTPPSTKTSQQVISELDTMSLLDTSAASIRMDDDDDDDDSDDDSYVPESLRNFLQEADKKLDSDLADLLAPIRSDEKKAMDPKRGIPDPNFEFDEDDDQEDNTIFHDILAKETDEHMKRQLMGALRTEKKEDGRQHVETQTNQSRLELQMELQHELPVELLPPPPPPPQSVSLATPLRPAEHTPPPHGQQLQQQTPVRDPTPITDKKDTDDALLAIINPSAQVTESHIKRVAMQGASSGKQSKARETHGGNNNNDRQQQTAIREGKGSMKTPSSSKKSSPSPLKQVERKLQKELDREAKRASIGTPPTGMSKRNHRVAPVPETTTTAAATKSTTSSQRQTPSKPTPPLSTPSKLTPQSSGSKKKSPPSIRQQLMAGVAPSTKAAIVDSAQVSKQVVAAPAPAFAHHPVPAHADGTADQERPAQRRVNENVFTVQGPAPIRRPAAKEASPQPFKAKPAPTPPKPKEISFNGSSGAPTSNRAVSPLHGGASHLPQAIETKPTRAGDMSPMISSPLHPRQLAPGPPSNNAVTQQPVTDGGRRPLTRPDRNIDRLVKPTSASIANSKNVTADASTNKVVMKSPPLASNDRLMRQTKAALARSKQPLTVEAQNRRTVTKKWSDEERRQAKANLQARVKALQARAKGTVMSVETTLGADTKGADGKDPRERLKQMEQARLAKLRAKIKLKNQRLRANLDKPKQILPVVRGEKAPVEQQKVKTLEPAARRRRRTIPVAPKFATDLRLHKQDPPEVKKKTDETLPLAASTRLFHMGLRASAPVPPKPTKRTLTIPVDPHFATTERHGNKATPASPQKGKGKGGFSDDSSWYSTLRDGITSPASKAGSARSGPTIPQTPNFQPIRQRPLPKSTAEKEREEMEYYKNHPFRARPVKMNPLPPSSLRNSKGLSGPPKRKLTTPVGFKLRTDERGSLSHDRNKEADEQESRQFKARPMPDFGGSHNETPFAGLPHSGHRQTTTPEPFHFQTTSRGAAYTPEVAQATTRKPSGKRLGKSRIPTGASGLLFQRRAHVKPEIKPFKAKPMPNFIPKTIRVSSPNDDVIDQEVNGIIADNSEKYRVRFSPPPAEEVKPFKAKPMPDFGTPSIPVQHRDPSKTRTPPSQPKQEGDPPAFHARPVPKSLTQDPAILVKDRNPKKLRSPDSIKRPSPPRPREEFRTFRAKPLPHAVLYEPSIPLRQRGPTKLRSPDSFGSSGTGSPHNVVETPSKFQARPVPKSALRPNIPVRDRDPTKLRSSPKSPETDASSPPKVIATPSKSQFQARPVPNSLSKPDIPVRGRESTKLRSSPEHHSTLKSQDRLNTSSDSAGLEREAAKARLKQRLALRKAAKKLENDPTKLSGTMTSPESFTSAKVRERLLRGTDNANATKPPPMKTPHRTEVSHAALGDVPHTISLPLKNAEDNKGAPPVRRTLTNEAHFQEQGQNHASPEFWDASMETPRAGNAKMSLPDSPTGENDHASYAAAAGGSTLGITSNDAVTSPEHEAELERETVIACATTKPDADESASVLALALAVQQMAEDELSFHGSLHSSIDQRGNYFG